MRYVYCPRCGTRLQVTRKALPKYGRIINLIEPHECPDEPVELDLTPIEVPAFSRTIEKDENKFVHNLNKLNKIPEEVHIGPFQGEDGYIDNPRDKRKPEDIKSNISSTAPRSLLDGVKSMQHVTPANDIKDEPDE